MGFLSRQEDGTSWLSYPLLGRAALLPWSEFYRCIYIVVFCTQMKLQSCISLEEICVQMPQKVPTNSIRTDSTYIFDQ